MKAPSSRFWPALAFVLALTALTAAPVLAAEEPLDADGEPAPTAVAPAPASEDALEVEASDGEPTPTAVAPTPASEDLLEVEASNDLTLYDIDGSAAKTLNGTYGNSLRVVIVGRAGCARTRATARRAVELSKDPAYRDINFLVLDCDGEREEFSNTYASFVQPRVRFFSSNDDTYNSWAWTQYRNAGNVSRSIMLPFLVLIDKAGNIYDRSNEGGSDTLAPIIKEVFGPGSACFPDVAAGAWYTGVVYRATDLGLMSGYANGKFGPADPITRGQAAVVLWNMAGRPQGSRGFEDLDPKAYYYDAMLWAGSKGVVSGYKDGRFGPNDKITREQFAVMLTNYARNVKGGNPKGSASDYASMRDKAKVSKWAQSSVGWCFKNAILSGSGGNVNPGGNASRAEAAKMVVVLHDLLG